MFLYFKRDSGADGHSVKKDLQWSDHLDTTNRVAARILYAAHEPCLYCPNRLKTSSGKCFSTEKHRKLFFFGFG